MELSNTTALSSERLQAIMAEAVGDWPTRRLRVFVRYSRGADFSGTCHSRRGVIYLNLGRHLRYPYRLGTSIARARSNARYWWKSVYTVGLRDAYQVVLFVFLHELYHWLVRRARRNTRRKESMCDRFATRCLVDRYGCVVRDETGRPVPRAAWDFQDVEAFVATARTSRSRARGARPVTPAVHTTIDAPESQRLLFDL